MGPDQLAQALDRLCQGRHADEFERLRHDRGRAGPALHLAGNVLEGAISVITSSIPGVDLVTNAAGFANGQPSETDPAYRARFVAWLLTLQAGTPGAVIFAAKTIRAIMGPTSTITPVMRRKRTIIPIEKVF